MVASATRIATASVDLFGHVGASRAFAIGLLFGSLTFLAGGVVAAFRRHSADGAGIEFAAGLVLGVRAAFGSHAAPLGLVAGLALLAVGGAVATRARPRLAMGWYVGFLRTAVALAPGAIVLVAAFPLHHPLWVRLAAGIGVLVAAPLVHDFDGAQGPRGAPFLLLAIAVVAVYYTVPDTALPLVMLGCCIPLVLLSIPQPLRRMGPSGTAAAIGAFTWVAAVGGRDRAAAVIAAVAALGLLLVEPLARRVPKSTVALGKKRRTRTRQSDNWLLVIGVAATSQLALGFYCATVVGRENDTALAALMVAPALVLLGAAAPFLLPVVKPGRREPVRHHHSRSRRAAGSGRGAGLT